MLHRSPFGTLADGSDVTAFELAGAPDGVRLTVLDLGATVARVRMPSGDGLVDVALGLPDAAGYAAPTNPYLGATVGRYANRIGGARFRLDGVEHRLAANEGPTCLHGGRDGFSARRWSVAEQTDGDGEAVLVLTLTSPAGDQGFPGEVTARVRYAVSSDTVTIEHVAETDAPTVVSLTNHAYVNLAGEGTVDEHRLTVASDAYLPVDADSIPFGTLEPVDGSPFDLRDGAPVGERVASDHPQVRQAGGIDHAFVLRGEGLRLAARLEHPPTGRTLEVSTTQPSVQVYTGQKLDGSLTDRGGRPLVARAGMALECQAYPDAPNQPAFPSAVLRPGDVYHHTTTWRLTTG
jgi:aldose 1-epimerase